MLSIGSPDLICEQRERLLQGRRVDGATIPGVLLCNPWKQLRPHAAKLLRSGMGDYRCTKSVLERLQVAARASKDVSQASRRCSISAIASDIGVSRQAAEEQR